MKYCPACSGRFPNSVSVCPLDQSPLYQSSEIEPGTIIRGKYVIIEKLGAGGMATVYRAQHKTFDEFRAIKVVNADLAENQEFLKRFRYEAKLTRKLRHPNAVSVEDFDITDDGRPFIAMELIEGENLRSIIRSEGVIPVPRALEITAQVASALAAAHELGIVHRDIKPDNVVVTRTERGTDVVKVLDFGIAKMKEAGAGDASYFSTGTGLLIGTPAYMSPEQAKGLKGDKLDGRSDLYSLGVSLYQMITGQLPFESDTPMGFVLEHINGVPVSPEHRRPSLGISPAVSAVVMKSLAKDPEARFANAEEMRRALLNAEAWQRGGTGEDGSWEGAGPPQEVPVPIRIVSDPSPAPKDRHRGLVETPKFVESPGFKVQKERLWNQLWFRCSVFLVLWGISRWVLFPTRSPTSDPANVSQPYTVEVRDKIDAQPQSPAKEKKSAGGRDQISRQLAAARRSYENGNLAAAADAYQSILKRDPQNKEAQAGMRNVTTARSVQDLVTKGERSLENGRYQEAIQAFQLAQERDPINVRARAGLKRAQTAKAAEDALIGRPK